MSEVADVEMTREIDEALRMWRQGDVALEQWFIHVADLAMPLSRAALEHAEASGQQAPGIQALTSEVVGLVVVTQTCDIVRSCLDRPYLEVAPLVHVDEKTWHEVERGRRPAYAMLPALNIGMVVADLDRVMTVEKSVVAKWERKAGLGTDADVRAFAQALARKRSRFAFPDDFTMQVRKLRERIDEKHGKCTEEGRGLRALREIRVCASPSWDASSPNIFFWFIRSDADATFEGTDWASLLEKWLSYFAPGERLQNVDGQVATLQDLTAEDYVSSDPLDLDHLTTTSSRGS